MAFQCAKKRHVGNPSGSFPELISEPRQHFSLSRRIFSIDKSTFNARKNATSKILLEVSPNFIPNLVSISLSFAAFFQSTNRDFSTGCDSSQLLVAPTRTHAAPDRWKPRPKVSSDGRTFVD
jgi:hypothetical protein